MRVELYLYSFFNRGADGGGRLTPQPLYLRRRDQVPISQVAGWAPGPVWTCAENLASTGIRFPDRPARSESLNRLSHTVPQLREVYTFKKATLPYFDETISLNSFIFLRKCLHCSWNIEGCKNVNMSLCTPWRHIWGAELQLHPFQTSALHGGDWSPLPPNTHWIEGSVGPRAGLDVGQ